MAIGMLLLGQNSCHAIDDVDSVQTAGGTAEAIRQIRVARDSGKFEQAFDLLVKLDQQIPDDLSLEFVLLVRKSGKQLDQAGRDHVYSLASKSMNKANPDAENFDQRLLLRSAIIRHFSISGKVDTLAGELVATLNDLAAASDWVNPNQADRSEPLIKLAMQTGNTLLRSGDPATAKTLYSAVYQLAEQPAWQTICEPFQSNSLLFWAWSTGLQPSRQREATERLQLFVDRYPAHPDAPGAVKMRMNCFDRLGEPQAADQSALRFIQTWPDHPAAPEVALRLLRRHSSNSKPIDTTLSNWLATSRSLESWTPELVRHALVTTTERHDQLAARLAMADQKGQHTTDLLHDLESAGKAELAEQFAVQFISVDSSPIAPMVRQAACRWLGRTDRWALLAAAAEATSPEADDPTRTANLERLFAEALTQTRRGATASRWWTHLVDVRGESDFATLLRCAENAVGHSDLSDAERRVQRLRRAVTPESSMSENGADQATTAAPVSSARLALVDLVDAELAIRQAKFQRARSLLESAIGRPGTPGFLQARAQWLIGETHFMQKDFATAISAYRAVEGLDPGSEFAAGSLIQAGKAFQQLGRTPEAGVCYGTLLERFADSPFADEARRRLAGLPDSKLSETKPQSQRARKIR